MKTPTKVWPLTDGLPGYNAQGHPIVLQPGTPGWMDMTEALEAEKAGAVDIMAGKTPQTLRTPQYQTRVMSAEPPPAPKAPSPPPPQEPEPEPEPDSEESPKAAPRRKTTAKKRPVYRRTDQSPK